MQTQDIVAAGARLGTGDRLVERIWQLRSQRPEQPLSGDKGADELRAFADRFFWAIAGLYE